MRRSFGRFGGKRPSNLFRKKSAISKLNWSTIQNCSTATVVCWPMSGSRSKCSTSYSYKRVWPNITQLKEKKHLNTTYYSKKQSNMPKIIITVFGTEPGNLTLQTAAV